MYIPTFDFQLMWESLPFILGGLSYTIGIAFASFFFGNLLGILFTTLSFLPNRWLNRVIRVLISFLRGVPALVILFLLYFGLPYQLDALTATIVCFSLTSSALGFSFPKVMRSIILPQAFRISIPALSNVAMDLVKGTSLAAMITIPDIFQKAKIVGGRTFDYMSMYVLVAIIYWCICLLIEYVQKYLEDYYLRRYGTIK
jgi:cystine transport system permease protein